MKIIIVVALFLISGIAQADKVIQGFLVFTESGIKACSTVTDSGNVICLDTVGEAKVCKPIMEAGQSLECDVGI